MLLSSWGCRWGSDQRRVLAYTPRRRCGFYRHSCEAGLSPRGPASAGTRGAAAQASLFVPGSLGALGLHPSCLAYAQAIASQTAPRLASSWLILSSNALSGRLAHQIAAGNMKRVLDQ